MQSSRVKDLVARWGDYEDVTRASMVLEWDQETYLPEGGVRARSAQLSGLAGLAHEKLVSRGFRDALKTTSRRRGLTPRERAMVREAEREHRRALRVPEALVREMAHAESQGLNAWRKAYAKNDWRGFAGNLAEIVRLKKRMAECIGYEGVPYDAHLDAFEPGATVDMLDPLLEELKEATIPLVRKIARSKRKPNRKLLLGSFPQEKQLEYGRRVVEAMGFDFTKGRIDLTTHPFCTSFDPADVRLTTRVDPHDLRECLFGLIHEAGHGLYEQGIDTGIVRTPLGHSISLGIHESQSRMWENVIGRSREFWTHFLPPLKRTFPQLGRARLDDFVFAINEVVPSFVRTEADEVTYNLHVVLRYEIEKDVFAGKVKTGDLPAIWNRKMKEALGIVPPTHSKGVLQDIHWSMGLFGYFPTYSLGNLYGAQFVAQARKDIPRFDAKIARGTLLPLREWLGKNIHKPGRTYPAPELLRRVTGTRLQVKPFVSYIEEKYGELYDL